MQTTYSSQVLNIKGGMIHELIAEEQTTPFVLLTWNSIIVWKQMTIIPQIY